MNITGVSEDPNVPALVLNEPHPFFLLYPARSEEYRVETDAELKWTEFEYIDTPRVDPTNVAFTAKVSSESRFNWAGKVNEVQCPLDIVKWPKGLEMEYIFIDHDRFTFDQLFPK